VTNQGLHSVSIWLVRRTVVKLDKGLAKAYFVFLTPWKRQSSTWRDWPIRKIKRIAIKFPSKQEVSKWSSQTNLWSITSSRALSFPRGQENKIGFCQTLVEFNNRTPDKPYRHWMKTLVCHACFGAWWYLDVTWYLVLRYNQNGDFHVSLTES
jgi:hypothetical protein